MSYKIKNKQKIYYLTDEHDDPFNHLFFKKKVPLLELTTFKILPLKADFVVLLSAYNTASS